MKLKGKVSKVEKLGDAVRVTADCSYDTLLSGRVRREATIDVDGDSASAYFIGRKIVVTIRPVVK